VLTVDSFGAKGSEHLQLYLHNNTGFKYMFKRILLSIQILDSVYEPIYTVNNLFNDFIMLYYNITLITLLL